MSTIGCNEFLNRLDEWIDGERDPDYRAHVRDCQTCRNVAQDLGNIQTAARGLASVEEEPPARVWTALREQLQREGLIRSPRQSWAAGLTQWLNEMSGGMARPALAGVYLALLIGVAFALSRPTSTQFNDSSWIRSTQTSTTPLSAELNTAEEDTVSSMAGFSSLVTASLHQSLAIVDNDIALCEKSVREDPENEEARDYLYEAYQQKADLLAQMNERGDDGR